MGELRELLRWSAERAADYREAVAELPVFPAAVDVDELRTALGSLRDDPTEPEVVVDELAGLIEPALVGTAGPRYFGFVTGSSLDAATAAEVLATGWDQFAFNGVTSPGAAVVEEVAGRG